MPVPIGLPLSPPVFALLREVIEEKVGLHYDSADMDLLRAKLSSRALEVGFESLLDYYYFLRYDPGGPRELDALAEQLVVNETYLWRELDALEVAVDEVLLPRVRAGHKARIWSAACATGEEPLTVALLLADRGLLDDVEIVATDISNRALDVARSGKLPRRALRRPDLPAHAAGRVRVMPDQTLTVSPSLVEKVRWHRLNLLDAGAIAEMGRFDVIFCRNVLIYFADATIRRVVGCLTESLMPDGALVVGVSESLLRFGTSLACEEKNGVFFYRKALT